MKCLEVIEVRSVDCNWEHLESKLQKLLNDIKQDKNKHTIVAYHHEMIDTDFSIHLHHDLKDVETGGSRLGLRLASALKEFGLVNHHIWIEIRCK